MSKIILNLSGTPASEESICLTHGYGYYAYVSSNNSFFHSVNEGTVYVAWCNKVLPHCQRRVLSGF